MWALAQIFAEQRPAELFVDDWHDTLFDTGPVKNAEDIDAQEFDQSVVREESLPVVHCIDW